MERKRNSIMKQYKAMVFGITIVMLIAFSCISTYSKSIDLNGVKVSLEATVSKKSISIGSGVNDEKYSKAMKDFEIAGRCL